MAMFNETTLLVTGGSGLLGRELRAIFPNATYPSSGECDVTDVESIRKFVADHHFSAILHAAAFTSPPRIDKDPICAIEVNIIGTANVARVCTESNLRLVYVSTDYVFDGEKGYYSESDPMYPVNKYAWSKLGGECAARLVDDVMIIRTSFGPNAFPFDRAFDDQWTSREPVGSIAVKIANPLRLGTTGVVHIGSQRRTVFDYAVSISPEKKILPLSREDVPFAVPKDTSLDCTRYESLIDGV